METIENLKEKNGGVDGIHFSILKRISSYIAKPLALILNQCLNIGLWPN